LTVVADAFELFGNAVPTFSGNVLIGMLAFKRVLCEYLRLQSQRHSQKSSCDFFVGHILISPRVSSRLHHPQILAGYAIEVEFVSWL